MSEISELAVHDFPALLREIADPPKKLFVRGTLPTDRVWLTVVGSRAMSSYGRDACDYLLGGLRGYPIAIVSGLAYGVDAAAHRAALKAGLPTIAVPGSGLNWDVLYPRAHVSLAKEILKAGGAHLSEFEPSMRAQDYTFPQRNRIMAGMAKATLIVEARERSGSLITARLATEYNRDLLVVPGSIWNEGSKGTHQFLKLGATPVTTPEDILQALGIAFERAIEKRTDLSGLELRVLEIIANPVSRDELIGALKLPISEANVLLSTMEIKELIKEEMGVMRRA